MSDQNNRKTFALIAGILAVGLLAASIVGGQMLSAQAQNPDDPMPVDLECETGAEVCEQQIEDAVHSVVSTSGTATVKVTPDKVSVTVGVETQAGTASEAAEQNAELMNKVIAALKELGIAEDQISTNWYSVYPVYGTVEPLTMCIEIYPVPPECQSRTEIVGYKASNSVTVTMDADEDVGAVIDGAIAAGANNVNGAYFFVSEERQQEIRDGLIKEAIDNARSRAAIAAGAVGMSIDGVKSISLNDVYFPVIYKDLAQSAVGGSTPIVPGQQEISQSVQVVFIMS